MRRPTVLALRCATVAALTAIGLLLHILSGSPSRVVAQSLTSGFPFASGCPSLLIFPSGCPVFVPQFIPQYAPPPGQYVGPPQTTQYVQPATAPVAQTVSVAPVVSSSAALPSATQVISLAAGSGAVAMQTGCDEVDLDAGSGMTVAQFLMKVSPSSNVSTISVLNTSQFIYISGPNGGTYGPVGSGKVALSVCIVGFGTTITP